MALLAASNWPFGVLIALPVMAVLFFAAFKFAHNSQQRVANMLLGVLGSIAGLAAFVVYVEHVDRRLEAWIPVLAPAAMAVGAAIGVAMSVAIRGGFARLIRGLPGQHATQQGAPHLQAPPPPDQPCG